MASDLVPSSREYYGSYSRPYRDRVLTEGRGSIDEYIKTAGKTQVTFREKLFEEHIHSGKLADGLPLNEGKIRVEGDLIARCHYSSIVYFLFPDVDYTSRYFDHRRLRTVESIGGSQRISVPDKVEIYGEKLIKQDRLEFETSEPLELIAKPSSFFHIPIPEEIYAEYCQIPLERAKVKRSDGIRKRGSTLVKLDNAHIQWADRYDVARRQKLVNRLDGAGMYTMLGCGGLGFLGGAGAMMYAMNQSGVGLVVVGGAGGIAGALAGGFVGTFVGFGLQYIADEALIPGIANSSREKDRRIKFKGYESLYDF